jgi:hypothetical protein
VTSKGKLPKTVSRLLLQHGETTSSQSSGVGQSFANILKNDLIASGESFGINVGSLLKGEFIT